MTDEQTRALADLEARLRTLAQGATVLADMAGGKVTEIGPVDRPGHPAAPARFADLVQSDLGSRFAHVEAAIAALHAATDPGTLRLVTEGD